MRVTDRALTGIHPYPNNPRKIPQRAIDMVAKSIDEFGWRQPIVVDDEGVILVGHTRFLAAQKLGIKKAPVHVATGLTEAQRKAYRLADNRLNQESSWELDLLTQELMDLKGLDFDLEIAVFQTSEVSRYLRGIGGGSADDDAPEVQDEAFSQPGDVWLLGDHRVMCGDSTNAEHVATLLAGAEPHLMVTDPPYGVSYDPEWRNEVTASKTKRTGVVMNDDQADWHEAWALFPGDVAYVWHSDRYADVVSQSLQAEGFQTRSHIIWAKQSLVMSRGDYHSQHETCYYAVRKGKKGHWTGDRKQSTLWHIPNRDQDAKTVHSTQKPVECMRRPIGNNSKVGESVYDPFLGSGTTLIAAHMDGRVCLGMELDPRYVDVIVRRWQTFTDQVASREGDGATIDAAG